MLNIKKEAKPLEQDVVEIASCPICSQVVTHMFYMQDSETGKKSKWYSCQCGVIWQLDKPTLTYDAKYSTRFDPYDKKIKYPYEYPIRVYGQLIEELIYGRKVLLVGTPTTHQAEYFKSRGWITYCIDKNIDRATDERHIQGDFETFTFNSDIKFDLIWIYHTLECFIYPKEALSKCKDLLSESGILFIATPDTDFIHIRSSSGFLHWKPTMNHIMWNKRSLVTCLESLGFNIIVTHRNYEHRFPERDDIQILAQKRFY